MQPLIVFDLDGTLIDSRLDLANSANDLLATYGAAPLPVDDIAGMVGEGAKVLVERVLRAGLGSDGGLTRGTPGSDRGQTPAFERFLDIYGRRLLEHTRLYDGLDTLIAGLSGRAALAVLTNKPERFAREILDAFGVATHFRWIVGGDQVFARKPDPASLNHLIQLASVSCDRTLLIGDSMIDVETARRAGVRVCVALYGFGAIRGNLVLDELDLRAGNARELGTAIGQWLTSLPNGARGH